jgi:hypothetical protein
MGIYDQIHGECPYCGLFIGRKNYRDRDGGCGIQIKEWITTGRTTTYDFNVGDVVPHIVSHITGKPVVRPFFEDCYKCNNIFKIPFEVREETDEKNRLIYKVYLMKFEKS